MRDTFRLAEAEKNGNFLGSNLLRAITVRGINATILPRFFCLCSEEGHESEEDEDDRGEKVASIFEGRWQCEGSSAYYQIEDVDKTCKKTSTSSQAGDFGPVRRLY